MEKRMKKNIIIFTSILIVITIINAIIVYLIVNNKENTISVEDVEINEEDENYEFVVDREDGVRINTSEKLKEEKNFEGLKIDNIQLVFKNSQTQLLATITNTTSRDIDATLVNVILYDKEGKEIVTLDGIISPTKRGESSQLNVNSSLDYSNAYDFKIIKKQ